MDLEGWSPGKLGQFARSLARVSAVTRAIGVLALFAGALVMMFGWSRADHRVDDAIAFGALGLSLACIGALVWGIGAFHAAFAHLTSRIVSLDDRSAEILKVFQRLEQRSVQGVANGGAAVVGPTAPPAVDATSATRVIDDVLPPVAASGPRLCLRCGETLRPDVTRCRNCLTKV